MRDRVRSAFRVLLALAMVAAGVLHFARPAFYVRIMPAWLPAQLALVYVSGAFEILGGAGILVPSVRRAAKWGLVALLIAVFPANVNMVLHPEETAGGTPVALLWLRLPLQAVFIAWVLWVGRSQGEAPLTA